MIRFNIPCRAGNEMAYLAKAVADNKLCGDGYYSKECQKWFEGNLDCSKTLMVPSCTHALELVGLLLNIKEGDEIIMPSFTFVSTANAFALKGARIVFVDIRPDTMNIDEKLIEQAITSKTKAIVPVHYAGIACEMDVIMSLASKYKIYVVEDAAQGMMSSYNGKKLGTIGHFGAYSFHETKNYTSGGEGGLLIINDTQFQERAEVLREKGTNRSKFLRGMVDKYSWIDVGSSYLPSELQSAYLLSQLEFAKEINNSRLHAWNIYYEELKTLAAQDCISLPIVPHGIEHNGHLFYLKTRDIHERTSLIEYLKDAGIQSAFHYVPLHSSFAGRKNGEFRGEDIFTTRDSERLLRIPLYYGITDEDLFYVSAKIKEFYS